MTATVTRNGKTTTVKNLGWLLRHWKQVQSFTVTIQDKATSPYDCVLKAHLDGAQYVTPFASITVLKHWIHRPVFRGKPLTIVDGDSKYITVC